MPAPARWFEDYAEGMVEEFGDRVVTEAEIIAFARDFDPQPFHVDPEAAKGSLYGGLIASGWHTAGLMMRMLVEHFVSPVASLGSPGLDELRWPRPVRPGDRLSVRATVLSARPSKSKPEMGIVQVQFEVLNQAQEPVMIARGINLYRRRPAGG